MYILKKKTLSDFVIDSNHGDHSVKTDVTNFLILITGYTGFLGSQLLNVLLKNGATVVGLQLRSVDKERGPQAFDVYENFYIKGFDDNLDTFIAEKSLDKKASACFHFAGNASAAACQKNPWSAYESNVQLTLRVLEYCRTLGVKKFIYPSTGYVYGNHLKEPASETNRLISTNIYTATKIAAEALIESYAHYHGFQCNIGRISNVYGKESSCETVSGTIIANALKGDPIVLNTLKPVRDFIFIDDVIDGFLTILKKENTKPCSYFNISTGIATSIQELAEITCRLVSLSKNKIISRNIDQYSNTKLVLSCHKLQTMFDWKPNHSLESGLKKILTRK